MLKPKLSVQLEFDECATGIQKEWAIREATCRLFLQEANYLQECALKVNAKNCTDTLDTVKVILDRLSEKIQHGLKSGGADEDLREVRQNLDRIKSRIAFEMWEADPDRRTIQSARSKGGTSTKELRKEEKQERINDVVILYNSLKDKPESARVGIIAKRLGHTPATVRNYLNEASVRPKKTKKR